MRALAFAESAIVKDESLYAPGPHLGSASGKFHAMPMDDPTETLYKIAELIWPAPWFVLSMTRCPGKPDAVRDGDCVTVGVRVSVWLLVCVLEGDWLGVAVRDGVPLGVAALEGVALIVVVTVADCVSVAVPDGVTDGVGATEGVAVPDGVTLAVRERLGVPLGLGVPDWLGEPEMVIEPTCVRVSIWLGDCVPL